MPNNITRSISKNKLTIAVMIAIIALILFAIYSLNSFLKNEEEEKVENISEYELTSEYGNSVTIDELEEEVTQELTQDSIENTMKKFVSYCNNGNISEAYAMITDDCKTALNYTTEEIFEKNYVNIRFDEPQEYNMTKWSSEGNISLYIVKFYGDLLATGGESGISQEYYTFVKEDDGYKININNFIYSKELGTTATENNITIELVKVSVYDSYQEVIVNVTNENDTRICLRGSTSSTRDVYLENSSGVKYSLMYSQLGLSDGIMEANSGYTYVLKFNKTYDVRNKAETITFNNIILDYDEYLEAEDKTEYTNTVTITMEY